MRAIAVILALVFWPVLACDSGSGEGPEAETGCPYNGALRCGENSTIERCHLGEWVYEADCPTKHTCLDRVWLSEAEVEVSTAYCANGEITEMGCNVPNEVTCLDGDIMRCLKVDAGGDKGAWWIVTSCAAGQSCETAAHTDDGTVYEAGYCSEPSGLGGPCDVPGASFCVESDIFTCGPHWEPMWFAWMRTETCLIGTECVESTGTNFAGDELPVATCQESP